MNAYALRTLAREGWTRWRPIGAAEFERHATAPHPRVQVIPTTIPADGRTCMTCAHFGGPVGGCERRERNAPAPDGCGPGFTLHRLRVPYRVNPWAPE